MASFYSVCSLNPKSGIDSASKVQPSLTGVDSKSKIINNGVNIYGDFADFGKKLRKVG